MRKLSFTVISTLFLVSGFLPLAYSHDAHDIVKLIKKEKEAVVNIRATKLVKKKMFLNPFLGRQFGGKMPRNPFERFFGDELFGGRTHPKTFKEKSLGSGVIIDKTGYIVTNFHVIDGADEITVKTTNDKKYTAKVIGRDKKTDIALIKINEKTDLPFAVMGSSEDVEVGESVIAIGNPFGLEQTVTKGIISAKGRVIGSGPYDDFLQTDASINPGNSGGPLFNMKGEIIGINTAIVASGQGIGFAIPIDMAKIVVRQLKNNGKVIRGWLGIMIQKVTPALAKNFNLGAQKGALVADVVKNSPADKAGLKRGDVVLKFDGIEIKNSRHLSKEAANRPVAKKVKVEIIRNSKPLTIEVVMGEFPDDNFLTKDGLRAESRIGITAQELTPEIKKKLGLDPRDEGVLISEVSEESNAFEAGLRRGDVIIEVNRTVIHTLDEYQNIISKLKANDTVLFLVKRESGTFYIAVSIDEKK